jgi:hypothetical protein
MSKPEECSHVIVEDTDEGRRYIYCQSEVTCHVGGNPFCTTHGFFNNSMQNIYIPETDSHA